MLILTTVILFGIFLSLLVICAAYKELGEIKELLTDVKEYQEIDKVAYYMGRKPEKR